VDRFRQIDSIRETTMREGMWCLWRDENGWRRQTLEGSDFDPDPSLLGAARLLWPGGWSAATRLWAEESLARHEWDILHPVTGGGDWLSEERYPVAELEHVGDLTRWFRSRPRPRAILSGSRNSGKSVSARLISTRLREYGWQTVVISPAQRLLPDDMETLPLVVESALRAAQTDESEPRLVVLEDLLALEEGNIGEIMSSLGHLDIGVLALTRYVDGAATTWNNEGVTLLLTQSHHDAIRALAGKLTNDYPKVYGAAQAERLDLAVAACRADLKVLSETLRAKEADPSEGGATPEEMLQSHLTTLREQLDDSTLPLVCRLAAISAMDDWVPESHVSTLSSEVLELIGLNRRARLVQISSRVRAELILEALEAVEEAENVVCP
jgi:hypothetical protein